MLSILLLWGEGGNGLAAVDDRRAKTTGKGGNVLGVNRLSFWAKRPILLTCFQLIIFHIFEVC